MYTISFFLRKSASKRQTLYCRIHPGDYWITTYEKLSSDTIKGKGTIKGEWDAVAHKVRPNHPSYLAINARLERIKHELDKFMRDADMNPVPVTNERLYEIVNPSRAKMRTAKSSHKQKAETLEQVFDNWKADHLEKANFGNKSGKVKGLNLPQNYSRAIALLREFRPSLEFADLAEKQTIEAFKKWLLTSKNMQDSTINIALTAIRVLLDYKGVSKAHVIKLKNKPTTKYALTWEEVIKLRDFEYEKKEYREAVDVFVIDCQICLRYSDLYNPALKHLVDLPGGKVKALNLTQGKTGDAVFIPFPPVAAELMERYGWELPLIKAASSTSKTGHFNKYLKAAAKLAGLDRKIRITEVRGGNVTEEWLPLHELISAHDARHTGASLMLEATGDMMLADALLGHSIASTYMHSNPVLVSNKLLDAWAKIEGEADLRNS